MERKSIQLERRQLNALEKLQEQQDSNESEAIRLALDRGLRELGYLDGLPKIAISMRVATMLLLLQCGGTIVAYGVLNQPVLQQLTMWFAGGAMLTYACSKYFAWGARRLEKQHGSES